MSTETEAEDKCLHDDTINSIDVDINPINVDKNPQRRGEEKRVKRRITRLRYRRFLKFLQKIKITNPEMVH